MGRTGRVRVAGPLAAYADGFGAELARLGYSRFTAEAQLQLMAHVSGWLEDRGLEAGQLTPARLQEYLAYRRACGHVHRLSPRGLAPLLVYLRGLGLAPDATVSPVITASDRLLVEFEEYLRRDRGLAARTVEGYRRMAGLFLASRRAAAGDNLQLGSLTAADVSAFMLEQSALRGAGSLGNMITALRALLRFLYLRQYTPLPLAAAVPAVCAARRAGPARTLTAGDVAWLLASCDRRTATGRRDYAILTVLVRLGLRAGEVAALTLDDIDWRAGELVVVSKGGRRDRLPLPVDVGQAQADNLQRGRPRGECRHVFVHARAPYCPMGRWAVSHVVARGCQRAGLPELRAHRLRHSAATEMHRAGAGLVEIGQILRHRHTTTTTIYARTDPEALISLARPWPGGGA
jgi:site-specific recombinase XerD